MTKSEGIPDGAAQPQDHLPPTDEREADAAENQGYPGTDAPGGGSAVSPETAAEPSEPARHGLAKLPPGRA